MSLIDKSGHQIGTVFSRIFQDDPLRRQFLISIWIATAAAGFLWGYALGSRWPPGPTPIAAASAFASDGPQFAGRLVSVEEW